MNETVATRPSKLLSTRFKNLKLSDKYSLSQQARKGVKPALYYDFAEAVNMPEKTLAGILNLSYRTVQNYRDQERLMEPQQSEHLLKLISLYCLGEKIFGNLEEFGYWLRKPFWGEKERPQDWIITSGGVDLLMEEIEKIGEGIII